MAPKNCPSPHLRDQPSGRCSGSSAYWVHLTAESRSPISWGSSDNKLVGGAITIFEKTWVPQWDGLSHIRWKTKAMFETTNQQTHSILTDFDQSWAIRCYTIGRSKLGCYPLIRPKPPRSVLTLQVKNTTVTGWAREKSICYKYSNIMYISMM